MSDVELRFRRALALGLDALGLELPAGAFEGMEAHHRELVRWRGRAGLTSLADPVEIAHRHFLDSLTLVPFLETGGRLVDLGTGAGFPGVPVALARPDLAVGLSERRGKKVAFLQQLLIELGAANLEILEASRPVPGPRVVARALGGVGASLRAAAPWLEVGGKLYLMRGPSTEGEGDLPGGWELRSAHPVEVPGEALRHRVLVLARCPRGGRDGTPEIQEPTTCCGS